MTVINLAPEAPLGLQLPTNTSAIDACVSGANTAMDYGPRVAPEHFSPIARVVWITAYNCAARGMRQ